MTANRSISCGQARQVLADVDAGDVGPDRLELAADLDRGVRLEVHHVLVRRPAGQEDHDDGLVRAADAGLGLGPQDLRQRQAAQGQAADLQKGPPRNAVAEPLRLAEDRQHGMTFREHTGGV